MSTFARRLHATRAFIELNLAMDTVNMSREERESMLASICEACMCSSLSNKENSVRICNQVVQSVLGRAAAIRQHANPMSATGVHMIAYKHEMLSLIQNLI